MKIVKASTVPDTTSVRASSGPKAGEDTRKVEPLGKLQTDRSFLPASKDQPVHKCGCT